MSEGVNVSTDGEITHILTPDEAFDLNTAVLKVVTDNAKRVRSLFRRWLIVASAVLALGVGFVSWQAHQIRTTQIANTKANACTTKAVDHAVDDVILGVFRHDVNPADYKTLKKC